MNEWDFGPLETLFGYQVSIARLQPGDILFLRPPGPTREIELIEMRERVLNILPPGVSAMFIPFDWEVGVARPVQEQTMVAGLQRMIEDLDG